MYKINRVILYVASFSLLTKHTHSIVLINSDQYYSHYLLLYYIFQKKSNNQIVYYIYQKEAILRKITSFNFTLIFSSSFWKCIWSIYYNSNSCNSFYCFYKFTIFKSLPQAWFYFKCCFFNILLLFFLNWLYFFN